MITKPTPPANPRGRRPFFHARLGQSRCVRVLTLGPIGYPERGHGGGRKLPPRTEVRRPRLLGRALLRAALITPHPPRSRFSSESSSVRESYFAVYWPRETRLNLPLLISVWFTIVRNEGEVVMYPAF